MKYLGVHTEPDEYVVTVFFYADTQEEASKIFRDYLKELELTESDNIRVRPVEYVETINMEYLNCKECNLEIFTYSKNNTDIITSTYNNSKLGKAKDCWDEFGIEKSTTITEIICPCGCINLFRHKNSISDMIK